MKKKILIITLVAAVLVVAAVGGTLAYLTATTDAVVNTFTVGNVKITLQEHDYLPATNTLATNFVTSNSDYKMIPGRILPKDPVVTVLADSEPCWLFIKVEESASVDDFLSYEIDSAWTALTGVSGVYYKAVGASTAAQAFNVLTDQQIIVNDTVTQAMMDTITNASIAVPQLTFTAYAIQYEGFDTAAAAWAEVGN